MNYIKVIILSLLITSSMAFAGPDLSQTQIKNMKTAYTYGKTKMPEHSGSRLDIGYIMAAILWQESSAGINCGKNGHAVGAFQNYIPTVKSRMSQNGVKKSNAQIAKELQSFNTSAHWANIELSYWIKVHKGNMPKALASYNAGWNHSAGSRYSRSVMTKANYLKSNNILRVE